MRISVKINREGYRTWFVWDLKEERTLLIRDKNYSPNVPTWEMVHDEPLIITEEITLSRDGRYALIKVLYLLPPEGRKNYTRRKIQVVDLASGETVREFDLAGLTLNWTGDVDADTLNDAPRGFAVLNPDNTVLGISRRTIWRAVQGRPFKTKCETEFWSMQTGECISRVKDYSLLGFTEDGGVILYDDGEGRIRFGISPEKPLERRLPVLRTERDYYNYGTSVYPLGGNLALIAKLPNFGRRHSASVSRSGTRRRGSIWEVTISSPARRIRAIPMFRTKMRSKNRRHAFCACLRNCAPCSILPGQGRNTA